MAIYHVTTTEQSGRGGNFSCSYLYDNERGILINNHGEINARVSMHVSELFKVAALAINPDYRQRDDGLGWRVIDASVVKTKMSESELDKAISILCPSMPAEYFASSPRRVA